MCGRTGEAPRLSAKEKWGLGVGFGDGHSSVDIQGDYWDGRMSGKGKWGEPVGGGTWSLLFSPHCSVNS